MKWFGLVLSLILLTPLACDFGGKGIESLEFLSISDSGKSPKEIPGLVYWADANYGITLDSAGQVLEWRDQSASTPGLALSLINNASGIRPQYIPLETNLNGYPAVHFTAQNQVLNFKGPDYASVFSSTNVSFGAVLIPNISSTGFFFRVGWNVSSAYETFFSLGQNANSFLTGFTKNSQKPAHHQTIAGTYQINRPFILIGEFTWNGSTINYVNGTRGVLDNQSIYNINPATLGQISRLRVGGDYTGKIAEIVYYQRRIGNQERHSLECHWIKKYRILSKCP